MLCSPAKLQYRTSFLWSRTEPHPQPSCLWVCHSTAKPAGIWIQPLICVHVTCSQRCSLCAVALLLKSSSLFLKISGLLVIVGKNAHTCFQHWMCTYVVNDWRVLSLSHSLLQPCRQHLTGPTFSLISKWNQHCSSFGNLLLHYETSPEWRVSGNLRRKPWGLQLLHYLRLSSTTPTFEVLWSVWRCRTTEDGAGLQKVYYSVALCKWGAGNMVHHCTEHNGHCQNVL